MIKRLLFLTPLLCIAPLAHCNDICTGDTYAFINNLTGKKLVDYVEKEGKSAFLFTNSYTPLDLSKSKKQFEDGFKKWDAFRACFDTWFKKTEPKKYSNPFLAYYLKELNTAFQTIKNTYLMLQTSNNNKSKLTQLKGTLIAEINKASAKDSPSLLFFYMLQYPLTEKVDKKLPDDVINEYKNITGINFNPTIFLNAYKKTEQALFKKFKEKELRPDEVLGILLGVTGTNPVVIKINASKLNNENEVQISVLEFIAMLEDLIYQSNRINVSQRFWQKKPSNVLSSTQIGEFENIIKKLYALYPEIITPLLEKRLNNPNKLSILLFAQARVLMVALQAYLKTVKTKLQSN